MSPARGGLREIPWKRRPAVMVTQNARSSTEQDIRDDLRGLPSRSQLRFRRAPWTMSAFRAEALMASPSWKSMGTYRLAVQTRVEEPFRILQLGPFWKRQPHRVLE